MPTTKRTIPYRAHDLDERRRLAEALAQDLWRLYGFKGTLNWIGVERYLRHLVEQARSDVRESRAAFGTMVAVACPSTHRVERRGTKTGPQMRGDRL